MPNTIRLLIADDHALVREGLKQLFALTGDIQVAAEAINGDQVLGALGKAQFDLLLLDMTMPGLAGPDLIAAVVARPTPPPILVLSMHNEPLIVRRTLLAGAAGYLTKDNDPEVLLAAIRKVARGGRFIDPALAEELAFEPVVQQGQRPPREVMTPREYEIFLAVAHGQGVNEIAARLAISNKTVSTHKSRLMEKMGFATNADIVRYVTLHGLDR